MMITYRACRAKTMVCLQMPNFLGALSKPAGGVCTPVMTSSGALSRCVVAARASWCLALCRRDVAFGEPAVKLGCSTSFRPSRRLLLSYCAAPRARYALRTLPPPLTKENLHMTGRDCVAHRPAEL